MDTRRDSVTHLLGRLKAGEGRPAAQLWERYFHRLVGLARTKLPAAYRRAADEEDVALSAFASFCRGVAADRFPRLADRDSLWRVLLTIVARKASHRRRDDHRQLRDINRTIDEAALDDGLNGLVSDEPTPEFVVELSEECDRLLAQLSSDELRQVAVLKMEGYLNSEIADRLQCAPRTVDRRLSLIRELWSAECRA